MPQYSIKLCTYDPAIIDAFDRLRKNRKQAAFTHEALKYFLATEKGVQVLSLMKGKPPEIVPLTTDTPRVNTPTERMDAANNSSFALPKDSSTVLDSILK